MGFYSITIPIKRPALEALPPPVQLPQRLPQTRIDLLEGLVLLLRLEWAAPAGRPLEPQLVTLPQLQLRRLLGVFLLHQHEDEVEVSARSPALPACLAAMLHAQPGTIIQQGAVGAMGRDGLTALAPEDHQHRVDGDPPALG